MSEQTDCTAGEAVGKTKVNCSSEYVEELETLNAGTKSQVENIAQFFFFFSESSGAV